MHADVLLCAQFHGLQITPSQWRWGSLIEQQRLAFAPRSEMTDEMLGEMQQVRGQAAREGLDAEDESEGT